MVENCLLIEDNILHFFLRSKLLSKFAVSVASCGECDNRQN